MSTAGFVRFRETAKFTTAIPGLASSHGRDPLNLAFPSYRLRQPELFLAFLVPITDDLTVVRGRIVILVRIFPHVPK